MADLVRQFNHYRLTTAKIIYHMPDFKDLLQEYIWQDYDLAPQYPELKRFLEFWSREIEGKLHSVFVASQELITPGDYRFAQYQETIQ